MLHSNRIAGLELARLLGIDPTYLDAERVSWSADLSSFPRSLQATSLPPATESTSPTAASVTGNAIFAGPGKAYDSFEFDGVGDFKNPLAAAAIGVDPDDIPDDTSTTVTIAVDGPPLISQLHTVGDQDFAKVELVAGRIYQIGEYAYVGGPSGVPLSDAYLELYDASGNLIVSADGGGPNTPQGLDALLTYEAAYTGTYYINARGFDQDPTNGTGGDAVGDYELFVVDATNDPSVQPPYYDADNPLYAIDWGSQQVDGTVRNPDGDEGTRDTGNLQGTPVDSGFAVEGKNVITIYFAKPGDVYTPEDPTNPGLPPAIVAVGAQDFERKAVFDSLAQFSAVADVVYVEVDNRDEANFHYVTYSGTPGPGISLLGSMSPPNEPDEGLAQFNSGDYRWNATNLQRGGFSYVTLIHEFGHGHGLAHPHDTGGGSGIMNGVEPEGAGVADYTTGDFELNQGVFTMMSYEDGWQSSPYGNAPTDVGYGYLGGLSAFDIAAIQDKYGVNEDWATGDDVYRLRDVNAAGTFYSCLWDAGGTDMISYTGSRNCTIDLRQATLRYEPGGGGYMSYAFGIYGGFTIANGATIENARGGYGNDHLVGNDSANLMYGRAGADALVSYDGDDLLFGGGGDDFIAGGAGDDIINGQEGSDRLTGGLGDDSVRGGSSTDILHGNAGDDVLRGGDGADQAFGDGGDDVIYGEAGSDRLDGGGGLDILIGGAERDILAGGEGADRFVFDDGDFAGLSNVDSDRITDFDQAQGDRINLSQVDAILGGTDDSFEFVGDAAFSKTAGELRFEHFGNAVTMIYGDLDGDGNADFAIRLDGIHQLVAADFIL